MTTRDIPNLISVLRILLVGPIVWLLLVERFTPALVLFVVAGASDALDGYLAKRYGWFTRLGSILDPLADKLLMVCAYLALGWLHLLPWWLIALVILRDLVIVLGALYYHLRIARIEMAPTLISKVNTLFQILLVFTTVAAQVHPLPSALIDILVLAVVVTTVSSGVTYVCIWGRRARPAGFPGRRND